VKLPPIDPSGPNLLTHQLPEEADTRSVVGERKLHQAANKVRQEDFETRSVASERRLSFFQAKSRQEKGAGEAELDFKSTWSHSDTKFASTGILSKLGKVFATLDALTQNKETEVTLPVKLVETLSQDHSKLVADTVIEKREWQTDCYLDYAVKNTNPFLTGVPEGAQRADTRYRLS
jgi:hypothetical protein